MAFSHLTQVGQAGLKPLGFAFDYNIAFQAIFELQTQSIWAYEALVRGPNGECGKEVWDKVPPTAFYAADQHYRETAIQLAVKLSMQERLSLNFLRGSLLGEEDHVAATMAFADKCGFPTNRIILEFSETEQVRELSKSRRAVNMHLSRGFQTALDDFGAGYHGLAFLCDVHPDIIKLDMALIRDIDHDPRRAKIVTAIVDLCRELGMTPVCEGIETHGELAFLADIGVNHIQGYLLARPQIGRLLSKDDIAAAFAPSPSRMKSTA